jgi:hypothetical protein
MESASSTVDASMATLSEVIRNELALRINLYNDSELTSLFEQYQASVMLDRSLAHNHLHWLRFVESGKSDAKPLIENLEELRNQADRIRKAVSVIQTMNHQIATAVAEQSTVAEDINQRLVPYRMPPSTPCGRVNSHLNRRKS